MDTSTGGTFGANKRDAGKARGAKDMSDIGDPVILTQEDRDKALDVLESIELDENTGFTAGGDEREDVGFDPDDEDNNDLY